MTGAFAEAAGPGFNAWAGSLFEPDHYDKVLLILHLGGQEDG